MTDRIVFPGILPDRVVDAPPVDPVIKGLRSIPHRQEIRDILVKHGATWEEITSTHKRYTGYVRARIEIALLLVERGWTYSKVSKLMRRHHTTVLYWFGRIGARKHG